MSDFEIVHTVTDYYDGPRGGIAEFRGKPHIYESKFDDVADEYSEAFHLFPIDRSTLELALEDWAIWLRWELAFYRGETDRETHPALPVDRQRHNELRLVLDDLLLIPKRGFFTATAEFRIRDAPEWPGVGWRPLEVKWSFVESIACP
ncbi:MAG: hypothetical protein H6822_25630 [Planctomycetaceae bacterium]|nr:hypothetical protein [Planctomycetaceae bacterium]